MLNAEYRQALNDVERLRNNYREVSPEFQDVVDLELQAAEKRLMSIIKEAKHDARNCI